MRATTTHLSHALLGAALLSLTNIAAFAAPVTTDQALRAAAGWGQLRMDGAQPLSIQEAGAAGAGELFWIQYQPAGWVLMAGDDAANPILGWSPDGWLGDAKPDALREWTDALAAETRRLRERPLAAVHADWAALTAASRGPVVTPLRTGDRVDPLMTSTWHQGSGWNADCPEDPSGPAGHCYTGCVATALAQVLRYWNWPSSGTGAVSYVLADYGSIAVDFAGADYDFAAMGDDAPVAETAELLYHAGVAVRMSYGPNLSLASTSNIPGALRNNFRYSNESSMRWRSSYTSESWTALLRGEMEGARPVIYRGSGTGGHAFCVDGVDEDDLFHVNWGWGGAYNGWFSLDGLEPGNYDFNAMQGAVTGIHPNEEWNAPNHAPVAQDLDVDIDEDMDLVLELLASDADNDDLEYEVDGQAVAHGEWSWTPQPDFNGERTFAWRAFDGLAWSAPAEIIVRVLPVNDAPVAADIQTQCVEDGSLSLVLSAEDPENDPLSYEVDGVIVDGGVWNWAPEVDFNGERSFAWRAFDGQAWSAQRQIVVQVSPVNDAPRMEDATVEIAEDTPLVLQLNATDPDGDALFFLVDGAVPPAGMLTWTPPENFFGTVELPVVVSDGQASDTAMLTVIVQPVNDAPRAFDHTIFAGDQREVTIKLDGLDCDGDAVSFFVDGQALSGNQVVVPVPKELDATIVVEYTVFDGSLHSEPGRIEIQRKLTITDGDGGGKPDVDLGDELGTQLDGAADEAEAVLLPTSPTLRPNYPNPFNPATTLVVALPAEMQVRLSVYNLTGALVATLQDGPLAAGEHRLSWNAGDLASGLYLAVLETAAGRDIRRMTLVR